MIRGFGRCFESEVLPGNRCLRRALYHDSRQRVEDVREAQRRDDFNPLQILKIGLPCSAQSRGALAKGSRV